MYEPLIDKSVLDDLLVRYLLNLPEQEYQHIRLLLHVREAHWFYNDFYVEDGAPLELPPEAGGPTTSRAPLHRLPKFKFREFAKELMTYATHTCPSNRLFQLLASQFDYYFHDFNRYLSQVPVYGAIILNTTLDKILLVMNSNQTSYSFPKGKINENENEIACAVREVWEEVGFNLRPYINSNDRLVCRNHDNNLITLYIVVGCADDYKFETHTRNEIGKIEFVRIADIEQNDRRSKYEYIKDFLPPLKRWISRYREEQLSKSDAYLKNFEEYLVNKGAKLELSEPKIQLENNPFLNFSLDRVALAAAVKN